MFEKVRPPPPPPRTRTLAHPASCPRVDPCARVHDGGGESYRSVCRGAGRCRRLPQPHDGPPGVHHRQGAAQRAEDRECPPSVRLGVRLVSSVMYRMSPRCYDGFR